MAMPPASVPAHMRDGLWSDQITQAYLLISYTAADGQITEWAETFHLNMGLPLTVNVQDFFRPDW